MPGSSSSSGATARRERAAAARAAQKRAERRRRALVRAVIAVVVLGLVGGLIAIIATQSSKKKPASGATGPEGIVLEAGTPLADLSAAPKGSTVDGVECNSAEQAAYHIHSHLSVFVNGVSRPVPGGVGAFEPTVQQTAQGAFYGASQCLYWLHVHAQDGIIHVESPTTRVYTLGQFFAIWGQPLSAAQVGPAKGKVTVYVNERLYTGDPAAIALKSREDIQLNVGKDVAPTKVDWSKSSL